MDCLLEQGHLVDFHFGTLVGPQREQCESHLLTCRACLREFITLKRDLELSASSPLTPSPAIRQRVFAQFGASFRAPKPSPRLLVGGLAAAMVVTLAILGYHIGYEGPRLGSSSSPALSTEPGMTSTPNSVIPWNTTLDSGVHNPRNITIL